MKDVLEIFSYLIPLAGAVCVIILTYYASKWYARKMGPFAGGKHIRVLDRQAVGKTASVMIIDVQGTQYLVGVSEQSICVLKELDEPIPLQAATAPGRPDFQSALKSFLRKSGDHEQRS